MKNYHGIIEHLLLIAQKQTELQNELHDQWKKGHQSDARNLHWTKSEGQILWTTIVICEMFKTPW